MSIFKIGKCYSAIRDGVLLAPFYGHQSPVLKSGDLVLVTGTRGMEPGWSGTIVRGNNCNKDVTLYGSDGNNFVEHKLEDGGMYRLTSVVTGHKIGPTADSEPIRDVVFTFISLVGIRGFWTLIEIDKIRYYIASEDLGIQFEKV
ncbi:hypothetical protein A3K34_02815 [candidate division WWE3 bacterium RIFOXYC1_FULL_40_10]|uniref:Uncharacterized protein n=1 Tax=candidate division WWE3 bacterium RIFOXYA2_FULL_46_9 TaxID=1802636 RepID=A0A1F4W027_UNCKA|nr:MAG: hypothetical protein A3K58_02815 [candidate division WWE3 bacterium RIFOXYB1_FULL_40_22]OGC61778.1 MAG: hypothetical protein A3K37_02815 [candidate division WWE3 bacterium RIFOXYA1_FULL_40_11]OGC62797.1 MAG: hypothetical protein A2264_03975 [candidate division WWE3 bacterium RIFOXYA2_FULL_46_9]OGC65173.1 MAG: hypothetical protein A2326_02335 [candidate division WWE3 bacterium RIFOXYB2_FULL_41_6]OGC66161.1 MAG: hypothetical protein A3K34_02815 [candidate division WWE3 bacterium RIFOXYC1_